MKKRFLSLAILGFLLLSPITVLASTVTNATYLTIVRVTNNSTAASGVSVNFTANTTDMINAGFMNSSGNNTAILFSGSDTAYMPGYGGNPWVAFVSAINANSIKDANFYSGGTGNMGGKIRYFPAAAGATVADNATIEPSSNFSVSISGHLDTTAGVTKWVFNKPGALAIIIDPSTSGNISVTQVIGVTIYTGMCPITGVPSGETTVTLTSDGVNMWLSAGGITSANYSTGAIANTIDDWVFSNNLAMTYISSIKIYKGGNPKANWDPLWSYASTFTDSVNGIVMTPTFRTTSSDSDVSAAIISQQPLNTSTGPSANTSGTGWTMITSVPNAPANLLSAPATDDFPGKALLSAMATANGVPPLALYRIIAMGTAIVFFLGIFALTNRINKGMRGSLLIAALAALGPLIYWNRVGGSVIPGWIFIPYGVAIVTMLLFRNSNTSPV